MTWRVNTLPEDCIELYNLSEEGGAVIRCYPNGNIRLGEIPKYGGEIDHGFFGTINEAMEFCNGWSQ